ncbi:hypothetical protein [Enhygromyxa salina]|uniref:CHAT domain protein n=1 Tax=Enhygromyxa salina TaxID=215803 RepID=A0A2S9Y615_9BACT|nr:hypothetical protein [Enhygromyxa salina]PRQ00451.1 hypothetical protein ENSA7_59450 [Enhygromyxa salina]
MPESLDAPAIRLICCDSLETYARVAASCSRGQGEAPVLGRPPLARGFGPAVGPGPQLVDASQWEPQNSGEAPSALPPSPGRLCVALDEPSCRVIAGCLAAATQRELALLDPADWVAQLEALLGRGELESLTLVLPLWSGAGLDPSWLGRALGFARTHERALAGLPWGILAASDPTRLSVVVAKSLVQHQIIAAYAEAPAVMFAAATAEALDCRLATLDADAGEPAGEDSGGGLRVIDHRHLRSATARVLARRAASLLYFRGHGRFYCGLEGHLCGARPLSVAPEAPIERCLDGLSCASPRDGSYDVDLRAFPRIDPRSYDTPLMVLDSCAAGGWSSPDWEQGIPSLAILALSGAPSGVVCGDYVTIATPLSHVEVFAVLHSSANLGEAVSRLNRARPQAVAEFPYFLLGDPELPVGPGRWPGWAAEPVELARQQGPMSQHIRARVPVDRPFVRVPLGIQGAHAATTFVRHADPGLDLHTLHLLTSDPPELWVALERPAGGDDLATLDILTVPAPRLPAGLLEAAVLTPLRVRAWTEALSPGVEPLLAAAANLERVEQLCSQVEGRALTMEPREILACVPSARDLWLRAHAGALAHALTLAPKGLWPNSLWKGTNYAGSTIADACPHCGVSPTLRREYDSGPALRRRQWECVACALILDRPVMPTMPMPELSVTMPTSIAPGQTITATLVLDNSALAHHFAVAGALLFDRKGHGVAAPPPFSFELHPGATHTETIELSLDGLPDIAHRYYARALLLVNGVWMMATRLVTVRAS